MFLSVLLNLSLKDFESDNLDLAMKKYQIFTICIQKLGKWSRYINVHESKNN